MSGATTDEGAPAPGPDDRVMVLAPHPDDETLAVGGLLQRAREAGAGVRVVVATDGENNPWTQRLVERRLRVGADDRARFGARRRDEARAALARLGLGGEAAIFLGLPDQGLEDLLGSEGARAVEGLSVSIAAFRPTILVSSSPADLHPDHSALAVLTCMALARLAPPAPRHLTYLVHGRRAGVAGIAPLRLTLTREQQERKRAAIRCYPTQLSVHRRRFLSFASADETYWPAPGAAADDPRHPVRLASVEGDELRMEIALSPRAGACGRPTLRILADRDGAGAQERRVVLDWRTGTAPLQGGAGGAPERRARLEGRGRRGLVAIPLTALPPADRFFVKVDRRFGFFDEAGWRAIPAPARRPTAAAAASAGPAPADLCCVIPCYNVAGLCGPVVREAAAHAGRVIVVDDGSTDGTGEVLRAAAAAAGGRVRLIRFETNRGKGAALLQAFRETLADPVCRIVVTLDGDGQHRPADLPRLAAACREGADLVIGERLQLWRMPFRSRIGNSMTREFLRRLDPRCPADTQSGFRAHGRDFLEEVLRTVRGTRYETELRVLLLALTQGRRIATVAIPTLYLDANRSSHYRPVADSVRIGAAILGWYLLARPAGR